MAVGGPASVLHRLVEVSVRPVKPTVEAHSRTPSWGKTYACDVWITTKLPGAVVDHQHLHCVAAQAAGNKMEEVAPVVAVRHV